MEMQPNQCFAVCQYVCLAVAAVLVACYSGAKRIQFNLYSVCTGREKESERQSKNKNRNTKYYVFKELSWFGEEEKRECEMGENVKKRPEMQKSKVENIFPLWPASEYSARKK